MRALVLCFGTVVAVVASGVLYGCAHGGADSTESSSESDIPLFWIGSVGGGVPRCPSTSLGPIEVGFRSDYGRDLRIMARMRGGDAVIRVTTVRGPSRSLVKGDLIRFTDPECRY